MPAISPESPKSSIAIRNVHAPINAEMDMMIHINGERKNVAVPELIQTHSANSKSFGVLYIVVPS